MGGGDPGLGFLIVDTRSHYQHRAKARSKKKIDARWATHEAVNKGAKVFGDWLLTLRGALPIPVDRRERGP